MFKAAEDATKKRREETLQKPARLRSFKNLQILKTHILNTLNNVDLNDASRSVYIKIRNFTITRLIFFNGRRVNEPARITIKQLETAFNDEWINEASLKRLRTLEDETLVKDNLMCYVSAKNSSSVVGLIIPIELKKHLVYLMSPSVRKNAMVQDENEFVFPNTKSVAHCSGYHAVRAVVDSTDIPRVTATSIRHYLSTIFAEENCDESARLLFCKHLGHSPNINEMVYQDPMAVATLTNVGKFLRRVDCQGENK